MLIQMSVAGMIHMDDEKSFFLLLKEMDGTIIISIQIDQLQAKSIDIFMDNAHTRIPDPYDFFGNIMDSFELRISKVIIKRARLNTRKADVFLTDGDREIRIESHSGDAIASALMIDAPIFMDNDFLGKAHKKELKKWLSKVKPGDFGEV